MRGGGVIGFPNGLEAGIHPRGQRGHIRFNKDVFMRTGDEVDLDPFASQFAPAIERIERTEKRLTARAQKGDPPAIRLRDVLAPGAQVNLPKFEFVLRELRCVDELLDIDHSPATWAGTLRKTAPEHGEFPLDQLAPLSGWKMQKVLEPEKRIFEEARKKRGTPPGNAIIVAVRRS